MLYSLQALNLTYLICALTSCLLKPLRIYCNGFTLASLW